MQGRPPRSRNERNQPQNIISEQELKMELEKQAEQKRSERRLLELQDKEELLRHYQNNALAMPQTDPELQEFVQQKQKNLNLQLQQQFPQEASHSESQRQLRLKLREEERLRRQNGLSSAYEQNKEPLPFQLERKLKENYNTNNVDNDPKRTLKEDLFAPQPVQAELAQRTTVQQNFYYPHEEVVIQEQAGAGQSKQSFRSRESQRQYRQELDQQITQKPKDLRDQVKPYSQQSIKRDDENFLDKFGQQRPQSGKNNYQQQSQVDERRRQQADQVMQQLLDQNQNNNQNGNLISQQTPISNDTNSYFRKNSSRQNPESDKLLEQKRKYKEELDRQIEEKNQQKEREKNLRKQQDTQLIPLGRQSVTPQTDYSNNQMSIQQQVSPNSRNQLPSQDSIQQPIYQQINSPGMRPPAPATPYQENQTYDYSARNQMTPQQDQFQYRQPEQQQNYQISPAYRPLITPQQQGQQQDQFQFNDPEQMNQPLRDEQQQQNYARTRHVTQNITQEDAQKQKMQRQQYAEELRRQVEEQKQKKKIEENRQKEEEHKLQKKIELQIEEEKRIQESLQKQKSEEVLEHQVANKQLAKRMQTQQKLKDQEPPKFDNEFDDLDSRRQPKVFQQINDEQRNQSPSGRQKKRETLFGSDEVVQQQPQFQNIEDQLPMNFNQQVPNNFMQQQPFQQNPFIQPPQQNFNQQYYQQPNYMNLMPQFPNPQIQQFQQFSPFQQFFDQVQNYQNALFNPQAGQSPQNMQIHQNYLLQLQQNRQEIEIVRQILEEKLRIQQLEMRNQLLVEEYRNKVKEIKNEEQLFQREIQKLQTYLGGKQQKIEPLNPQVFQSALQLSIIGINQQRLQQENNIQKLLPKQCQPQQQVESYYEEDTELPGDSDYVPFENNSMLPQQVPNQKSFYEDIRDYRGSQVRNPLRLSVIENIEEFQMQSEVDESMEDNQSEKNYAEQLNGFDVNLLRTQDYMNMFRQNIQSQSRQQELKIPVNLLKQNSDSLENMSQIESKPLFSQWSQIVQSDNQKVEGMLKFQSKQQEVQQQQLNSSVLAVSASIPFSQLQGKEVQMSEAMFEQDPNTLILPEDDQDDLVEVIQKPETAGDMLKPETPASNYHTASVRGEYESCNSKKFKKPKTVDIFQKLEVNSKQSSRPVVTNQSIQDLDVNHEEAKQVEVDLPPKIPQIQTSQIKSSHQEANHISQHYQSMSNYTQLNPLTSQTTFIVQQENNKNFLQEIDQSKVSVFNQSKRQIHTPSNLEPRRTTSRKAKQLLEARKEDQVINQQLDVLRESQESEPNGNSNLCKAYDFNYEESINQYDFQKEKN